MNILKSLYWGLRNRYFPSLVTYGMGKMLLSVYDGTAGHNADLRSGFLGFGLLHYALVRNTRPLRILCIGSRRGFIPVILALACRDNGRGHVDFVDAGYGPDTPSKNWSGSGFWKTKEAQNHFSTAGVERFITTHVMTTKQFAQKFPGRTYGYIYVDGDHSYRGVKLDHDLFWPRLTRNGYIVFHDVVARGRLDGGEFGVWKFWQEQPDQNKITLPFPAESGLGIIQKP